VQAVTFPFSRNRKEIEAIQRRVPDVVVTDLVMPEMSGFDLGRRLRDLAPSAAVIYMSGYAPDQRVQKAIHSGEIEVLHKPFSLLRLVERVAASTAASATDDKWLW
jgi:DNA-binding NtrC family response regulator